LDLIKITDLVEQLGLSSRSLRYYEQVGLIQSVRPQFEKYRFYDNDNIERLKQIIVLRKMQIPVKDIIRIYESEDMSTVVEVFVNRIQEIDNEVDALTELKRIVSDFLQTMVKNGITKISAIPLLYEEMDKQLEILEERKSYSKTDKDATFMMMKEDDMKRGKPKPGYNVQIGTEEQFITGFSIHQKPGDITTLKEHIEKLKKNMSDTLPKNVIADAGYGSEENYEYLEEQEITGYVKYNTFHKEAGKEWKNDPTRVQNFSYEKETDTYTCPMGRTFVFLHEYKRKSTTGYESITRVYECLSCNGCQHQSNCLKFSEGSPNRRIHINRRLNELKANARNLLTSEYGLEMRSKRPIEVESVFGNIKSNYGMRRFLLRGLKKVSIEWGLHSIAHNMRKIAAATS